MNQTYKNTRSEYEEKLVQCPYVPSHSVRPGTRLQLHLQKCRENTTKDTTSPFHKKALRMRICRYNTVHHVLDDHVAEHERNCPDSVSVLRLKYGEEGDVDPATLAWKSVIPDVHQFEVRTTTSQAQRRQLEEEEEEEDWEREASGCTASYDPMKKLESHGGEFLYTPQGKTRSEKRQYRQDQRMKVNAPVAPGPPPPAAAAAAAAAPTTAAQQHFNVDNDDWAPTPQPQHGHDSTTADGAKYKPLRRPQEVVDILPKTYSHGRGRRIIDDGGSGGVSDLTDTLAWSSVGAGFGRGGGGGRGRSSVPPGFDAK